MKRISKMKQLPCIRDKCICYPACRNKESIDCDELAMYFYEYATSMINPYTGKSIWFKICKNLPNLNELKGTHECGLKVKEHKPMPAEWWYDRRARGLKCYTSKGIP